MTFSQYIKEKSSPTIKRIVYFSAMGLTTLFGFLLLFSPFCLFEQEGKESLVKLTPICSG